jgi:hypothetical protein
MPVGSRGDAKTRRKNDWLRRDLGVEVFRYVGLGPIAVVDCGAERQARRSAIRAARCFRSNERRLWSPVCPIALRVLPVLPGSFSQILATTIGAQDKVVNISRGGCFHKGLIA